MKQIPVVFENDFCVVFNKPAGLPVQGGEGIKTSLDSILAAMDPPRPLLVHRLDRDTSGLILTARGREAASAFGALFGGGREGARRAGQPHAGRHGEETRRVQKKYIAVCAGVPARGKGVIRLPLDVRGREKESETSYRVLSSASAGGVPCSLLELELGSGRMHQIRRHLLAIGHPVLGDDKYGDFSLNRELKKKAGVKSLLLHAHRLFLPPLEPYLPEGAGLEAPPPPEFSLLRLDNGLSFFP